MSNTKKLIEDNIDNKHREKVFRLEENSSALKEVEEFSATFGGIAFTEKLFLFLHDQTEYPTCGCGSPRVFKSLRRGYSTYCSSKQCTYKNSQVSRKVSASMSLQTGDQKALTAKKKQATFFSKYGVAHPMKNPTVAASVAGTNLLRYGKKSTLSVSAVKDKIQETNLRKYGSIHASASADVQLKIQSTNLERYNSKSHLSSPQIREKIQHTMVDRYGVPNPAQSDIVKNKIKQTMFDRHGVGNASQIGISPASLEILGSKECLENAYTELNTIQLAKHLGVSRDSIVEYLHRHQIPVRHEKTSNFHLEVEAYISSLGIKCSRNERILSNREIDIYLPDYSIGIECNGTYWHSELNGKDRNYHLSKKQLYEAAGIDILYIWEHDWESKNSLVKSRIAARLGKVQRVHARKCKIREIDNRVANEFLSVSHIQGGCKASYRLGLYLDNELVSVMTFGRCRYGQSATYELLRFATKPGMLVVGGASRLFKHFTDTVSAGESIISYCDKEFNNGRVYLQIGFTKVRDTAPGYMYTKNYKSVFNRINFQKFRLSRILEKFDPLKSEWENMKIGGYDRIWNCGNSVFIWNK